MNTAKILAELERKHAGESEYLQAVKEVLHSIEEIYDDYPEFADVSIVERIVEPDRIITFRVPWCGDDGKVHVNLGYRVQFNNAIGPYKGGLRFHHTVNLSVLKFLGFEQTFKNALTTLPMGGAKGGSDFDPKGKSDREIMRFCLSFMTELYKYIGPDTDIPAGDIGVGAREIGYLFGAYKKITREHTGTLTGKGYDFGGSKLRPESTGYGVVYFLEHMCRANNDTIQGKTVAISGFGNVSWGVAKKCTELGAKVVTISGPDGYIYDPDGINTPEKFQTLLDLRGSGKDVVEDYLERFPNATFHPGKKPWEVKCDVAIPCAIQNELDEEDAKTLVANGVQYVVEASNMGNTDGAVNYFINHKINFAPGKAANAGGVATSGLEMTQNAAHRSWTEAEVDTALKSIMSGIHEQCTQYGREDTGYINYVKGANIAGFLKVARAMLSQGVW